MLKAVADFKRISGDFLKLMTHKAGQATKNRYAAREHELLEGFYAGIESILTNVEHEHDHLRIQLNFYKKMSEVLKEELEANTKASLKVPERPNKTQFEKIKQRYAKGDLTISQICEHFYVTDDEIKDILDGQKQVAK